MNFKLGQKVWYWWDDEKLIQGTIISDFFGLPVIKALDKYNKQYCRKGISLANVTCGYFTNKKEALKHKKRKQK